MTKIETATQTQLIAVSRLEKSPLNARRTVRSDGLGDLKASLLAHGLMQNLVVTDAGDGLFHVIAGGRRLEAIRALQTEGKLPDDFAVPCQVVTEEYALEMSLAENKGARADRTGFVLDRERQPEIIALAEDSDALGNTPVALSNATIGRRSV